MDILEKEGAFEMDFKKHFKASVEYNKYIKRKKVFLK